MEQKRKLRQLSLREIQLKELELLKKFDKFCQENHLEYFLCGGTLLGAIRHKGFIPWDDDIDVFMPRPEFGKLQKLLKKNNKLGKAEFTSYFLKNSIYPFIKLEDINTFYEYDKSDLASHRIWIDIFAIDGFSNNKVIDRLIITLVRIFKFMLLLVIKATSSIQGKSKLKIFCYRVTRPIALLFPRTVLPRMLEIFSKTISYEKSLWVGGVQWGYGLNEKLPKSGIERIDVEFEGHIFPGLKCYEQYLTQLYGNYMELPPVEKRTPHMASDNVFEIVELDEN